ncbi:MAG: type II secretion system protein [Candidatus Gastranaerophilaceae bacterium]|nr:type II secretion system protein [Candidatus Gastranaerophilaceae bacterium]
MSEFSPRGGGETSCDKGFNGFTLAEVLITLGIIGVVAAMTLPTLIQNHKKNVNLNLLKQTYSQISNAVELVSAEFDTLPMHKWSCNEGWAEGQYNQENCFYLAMEKVAAKMYPQVDDAKHAFCYEGKDYTPHQFLKGGEFLPMAYSWSAQMPNGACVLWHAHAWNGDYNGTLFIDVDGPYKGYNTAGKDLFLFMYASGARGLGPNGRTIYPYGFGIENYTGEPVVVTSPTVNGMKGSINGCSKDGLGRYCAGLIFLSGWTMPKDYPW